MEPKIKIQRSFEGGINLFNDDVSIGEKEYRAAFNVRNRKVSLSPIKAHLKDTTAPVGKKQGFTSFDKYDILFCSGYAYYSDTTLTTPVWTKIDDLYLDPNVNYIYSQAVPESTTNYKRVLKDSSTIDGTSTDTGVKGVNITINGTPAGLVVQDGINQPWLIKSDLTVVRLQKYTEWTEASREYVPIGTRMTYVNGILFVINGNQILRSVSGRPLDFVTNITATGDKGGDAYTMAYAVSYEDITFIGSISSGYLLVGTEFKCYPIELNYDRVIFQEPTFRNLKSFEAGVVNQFSFIDILQDYAFVDFDGVRSFNAVASENNEGRNSIFSLKISDIFDKIVQDRDFSACIVYDNYSFFSVKSIYGYIIAVYDNKRQVWVSFDQSDVSKIKQFSISSKSINPILYAITDTEVYKLYQGETNEQAQVTFGADNAGDARSELKLKNVKTVFSNSDSVSVVSVTEISGGQRGATVKERLSVGNLGILYPALYPVLFSSGGAVDNINFAFEKQSTVNWKVGVIVTWRNAARLLLLQQESNQDVQTTQLKQRSKLYP